MKSKRLLAVVIVSAVSCVSMFSQQAGKVKGGKTEAGKAPSGKDRWAFLPAIVATYGNKKVTRQDFLKELKDKVPMGVDELPQDKLKPLARHVLNKMIDEDILVQAAEKDGIKATPGLVKSEFQNLLKQLTPEELEAFKAVLASRKSDLKSYEKKLCANSEAIEGMAIHRWQQVKFKKALVASDAEVAKFYQENKEQFKRESIPISHILVKVDEALVDDPKTCKAEYDRAKKEADKIYQRIQKGEKFTAIAVKESDCPSGPEKNGSLGSIERGTLAVEIEDVIFNMKPGEISQPIKSPAGYHIARADGPVKSSYASLNDVKDFIVSTIEAEKINEATASFLEKERKALKVKLNF